MQPSLCLWLMGSFRREGTGDEGGRSDTTGMRRVPEEYNEDWYWYTPCLGTGSTERCRDGNPEVDTWLDWGGNRGETSVAGRGRVPVKSTPGVPFP